MAARCLGGCPKGETVFVDGFDPAAALAACRCPKCIRGGLAPIQEETYRAAPLSARVESAFTIDPSLYAQCCGCGAVMEWPGCFSQCRRRAPKRGPRGLTGEPGVAQ